jgi:putative restriction endonuclease
MNEFQEIVIDNEHYKIIDSIQDWRVPDSFVHRRLKLNRFKGNGEARLYIGSYKNSKIKRLSNFFEYSNWGIESSRYSTIQRKCFFTKSNLQDYLNDSREEYDNQFQMYNNDIAPYFIDNKKNVNNLGSEKKYFTINDISDINSTGRNRAYIRSENNSDIWSIFRELILPHVSYFSILKLKKDVKSEPEFYFRIFLDYQYRSIKWGDEFIFDNLDGDNDDKAIRRQEKWKVDVHKLMPQCPFTLISDIRLLEASHIKPFSVCKNEDNNEEANDPKNGISLTSTYHKLFDRGYITFSDKGELICGTKLHSITWSMLNINPNSNNKMKIFPENKVKYLSWHRDNIFKG